MTTTWADVDEAILAAIRDGYRSLITDRDDWRDPHVSDVYGCDYATHARRSAKTKLVEAREPEGCLKMALGNDVEGYVEKGLRKFFESQDGEVERGERIAWDPFSDTVRRGLLDAGHFVLDPQQSTGELKISFPCEGCQHCSPDAGEMIGHLDFVAHGPWGEWLFEIKSTSFFRGQVPREPSPHYIEQAATYATAIAAQRAGIIIACRESGRTAGPFWLELDELPPTIEGIYDPTAGTLREQTIARAKRMIEATSPEAFPPDPKPRYLWQPKYCNLGEACACISKS